MAMNNSDIQLLAHEIAQRHNVSDDDAERFIEQLFGLICDALGSDKMVKIRGLGTFKVTDTKNRESVDVNTGERITIEGHNRVTFTPDNLMKELVNKPFSQFESVVLNDGVDFSEMDNSKNGNDGNGIGGRQKGAETAVNATTDAANEASAAVETHSRQPAANEEEKVEAHPQVPEEQESPAGQVIPQAVEQQDAPAEEADRHVQEQRVATAEQAVTPCKNETEDAEKQEEGRAQELYDEAGHAADSPATVDEGQSTADAGESEADDANEENTGNEEAEMPNRSSSRLYMALIFLMVGVIMFGIGYFAGTNDILRIMHKAPAEPKIAAVKQTVVVAAAADTMVPKDTVPADANVKAPSASPEKGNANAPLSAEPNADTAAATASDDPALATARYMVEHGAYTIVGTMETIRVRKGMNLKKIAKAYFGDGMECYLQVHNGAIDIAEGEKIKIPELKVKKRK